MAGGYYMQEKDFKKLLIDTVKISDHPDKEKIINLLRLALVEDGLEFG